MLCKRIGIALGTLLGAFGSVACATSAANLKPESLPSDRGAVFGHIEVVNESEDVTSKCYVLFTDHAEQRKAYLSLDKTGWVFTAVTPGATYLSDVVCTVGGLIKYNAQYHTRTVAFDVPGKGKIAYFGHVFLDLRSEGGVVGATLLLGAVGNALASAGEGKEGQLDVRDHFEAATREYQQRYGQPSPLTPVSSVSNRPAATPALATSAPPDAAVGFALGKPISAAEARCATANLEWQKLDSGRYTCSGPAVDQGVPLKITLSECEGLVCEVSADTDEATIRAQDARARRLRRWSAALLRRRACAHQYRLALGEPSGRVARARRGTERQADAGAPLRHFRAGSPT